jgi:hypothetical protein
MWMKIVSSMFVSGKCHMSFELSWLQWPLHIHSEHWQHFQSVFLSLAVGQIEHLVLRMPETMHKPQKANSSSEMIFPQLSALVWWQISFSTSQVMKSFRVSAWNIFTKSSQSWLTNNYIVLPIVTHNRGSLFQIRPL